MRPLARTLSPAGVRSRTRRSTRLAAALSMTPAKTPPLAVALDAAVFDNDAGQDAAAGRDAAAGQPRIAQVLTAGRGSEPRAAVDAAGLSGGCHYAR